MKPGNSSRASRWHPTPRSSDSAVEDSDLTRYWAAIVNEHAQRYGWSVRQRNAVIRSLRVLQTLRPTPTAKIRASDVVGLRRYGGTISSTIDVLAGADLLIEDVPTRVETYFVTKTSTVPPLMRQHLALLGSPALDGDLGF
jgi:hypothetical protein